MPSTSLFAAQSDDYRERILSADVPILVIEAGAPVGWQSFVGPRIAVIGIDTFGSSAPGPLVMEHYGFTAENVCRQAHVYLTRTRRKHHARWNRLRPWRVRSERADRQFAPRCCL